MTKLIEDFELTKPARRVRRGRRARRLFAAVAGVVSAVLVLVALVALIPLTQGDAFVGPAILIVAAVAAVFLPRKLRAGQRPHVLYLRRFRVAGTEEAVTFGAAGAVGADYRLVTLDDGMLAPIGIPKQVRRRTHRGLFVAVGVIAGCVFLLVWLVPGVFNSVMDSTLSSFTFVPLDVPKGEGIVGAIVGVFIGFFVQLIALVLEAFVFTLLAGLIAGMVAIAVAMPWVLVGTLGLRATLMAVGGALAIRRAERSRQVEIQEPGQIAELRKRLSRYRRKRLAPRLVVARVKDAIWQDVVTAVSADCFATLLDVTYPSEALYWEAKRFLRDDPRPCLIVAEKNAVAEWLEGGGSDALHRRFRDLLRSETVILLTAPDLRAEQRFSTALRAALDDLWAGRTVAERPAA